MKKTQNNWMRRDIPLILTAAVVLAGGLTWAVLPGSSSTLWQAVSSVEAVGDLIRSWGNWGVAASVALMVISAATPFPAELVALANGAVFGPGWGIAITWGGGMLGAILAFGFSRKLGRPFVHALVPLSDRRWEGEPNLCRRHPSRKRPDGTCSAELSHPSR